MSKSTAEGKREDSSEEEPTPPEEENIQRYEAVLMHKILQYQKRFPEGASIKQLWDALERHNIKTTESFKQYLPDEEAIRAAITSINKRYENYFKVEAISSYRADNEERFFINPKALISRYLTSRILLEITIVARRYGYPNLKRLGQYLVKKLWFKESIYGQEGRIGDEFIDHKLNWLLTSGYIRYNKIYKRSCYIEVAKRAEFEKEYWLLLATYEPKDNPIAPSPPKKDIESLVVEIEEEDEETFSKPDEENVNLNFPALDEFISASRKFVQALRNTTDRVSLWRALKTTQILEETAQEELANKVFKDTKTVGNIWESKEEQENNRTYLTLERNKAVGVTKVRRSLGRKETLDKEVESLRERILKSEPQEIER